MAAKPQAHEDRFTSKKKDSNMIATIKKADDAKPISLEEAIQMPSGILLVMSCYPDYVYLTTGLSEWPFVKLAPTGSSYLVSKDGFSGTVPFELFRCSLTLRNSPERLSGERG